MYNFTDITKSASVLSAPSDDLMINGKSIDIEGYRQIWTDGRGIMSQDVDTVDIPARDGVWFEGTKVKPRVLTVGYVLKAETSKDLRNKFTALNRLLRQSELLVLTFLDEPEWTYYGTLQDANSPKEDTLTFEGSFSFFCPDPYKKGQKLTSTGRITLTDAFTVLPDKITATVTGTVSKVEIINGTKKITLNGSYQSGATITITYGEEVKIIYQGRSILSEVSFNSNIEDFFLKNGDSVTAVNATISSIEWRDERL